MKLTVKVASVAFAFAIFAGVAVSDAKAAFTRDLTLGSTGADVIELQTWLETKGFLTIPAGTSKGYFGALTQSALAKYQASAGITPAAGYFGPVTRAKIAADAGTGSNPGTGSNNGGLNGGDGDIDSISETTSGTETTLGEGKTEDVLGFDLEADDNSDLEVTSVRVAIGTGSAGSNRISRYLDEVAIMLDGEEVGAVDASDFSRKSSTSTATISLDDAVIEAGEEGRFYVTLTASDSINDSDLDNTLTVAVDRVRVEDAAGAVLTEDVDDVITVVDLEDSSADDDARVKISSDTRDAGLLKIDTNKASEDFDILSFGFDVDEDSSDLIVTEITVDLEVDNASTTQALDVEKLVQDISLEIDGEAYDDYEFEADHSVAANSTETVSVVFTIDEDDLVLTAGDVTDAVVFVKFGKQENNYAQGTTIKASVAGSAIDAENGEGDDFDVSGTATGKVQTVQESAAEVGSFKWVVNNTGTILDFFFTVEAEDEDFDVLSSSIVATKSGSATTTGPVLSFTSGDATTNSAGVSYTVVDGDTATFRIRYEAAGNNDNGTSFEVKVTSVAGKEVPNEDQLSPTATKNVN